MSKYFSKRSNGYASKREEKRAQELRLLERAGVITDLAEQVKFELIPKQEGERACHYIADFCYFDKEQMCKVVEDVKGYRTPDYTIKRKLMLFRHGIRVREV